MDGEEELSMQYFDSRNVHRIYRIAINDAELRTWRDAPGFEQRFAGKLGPTNSTMEGVWQLNQANQGFRDDLTITFRR
jgi:hypothetical protein